MEIFSWMLGLVAAIFIVVMAFSFGLNAGASGVRNQYMTCIVLKAPQENCIKQMLGDKQ